MDKEDAVKLLIRINQNMAEISSKLTDIIESPDTSAEIKSIAEAIMILLDKNITGLNTELDLEDWEDRL